ncbi:hypothetical protein [Cellulomonas carbonis]|uniref:Uncharacterized protein n=1 Tax=Cellulomonas carbonis T26 TaxID=947969 RepID=A0A0A0BQ65_9CELL|nr:hypothetical protein [Cellulomonas carbonis]KGM10105.1 hypothetical protein N868_16680 [Cellulomonas carbonis T26]GGB94172.1 hypothetical protein GCM10010972_03560 [Cellulomonas carbonis]
MTWVDVLVGLGALLLSALGGWPLTAAILRWAARSSDAETGPVEEPLTPETPSRPAPSGHGHRRDEAPVPPPPGAVQGARTTDDEPVPDRAVLRGGVWIGVLERLGTTGALVLGDPSAIAYVIAIKGLGRYPELREHPGLSERFVIGTLASLGWAVAVGVAGRALVV